MGQSGSLTAGKRLEDSENCCPTLKPSPLLARLLGCRLLLARGHVVVGVQAQQPAAFWRLRASRCAGTRRLQQCSSEARCRKRQARGGAAGCPRPWTGILVSERARWGIERERPEREARSARRRRRRRSRAEVEERMDVRGAWLEAWNVEGFGQLGPLLVLIKLLLIHKAAHLGITGINLGRNTKHRIY